jgi:hypothetical protein
MLPQSAVLVMTRSLMSGDALRYLASMPGDKPRGINPGA